MEPFRDVHGTALPLMIPDIDTDQMINRDFLITRSRKGLGRGLFHDLRFRDGVPVADFVMNLPWFADPVVLLGGPNFACGSSREHAVWAVQDYGIRAVIAPSFGVHFRRNALKNGLLPVELPEEAVAAMARAVEDSRGARKVAVALAPQTVTLDGAAPLHFEIDDEAKTTLAEGLDDIGRTLRRTGRIEAWQNGDRAARPWVYLDR
jgi:3-isopropylmalate/(R)-2-methylmalate dehydratase small subunit